MKMWSDAHLRRDIFKLVCVAAALSGLIALFFITPALSTPTFVSLVFMLMLTPLVAALERRGYSRATSVGILYGTIGVAALGLSVYAIQSGQAQWGSFKEKAPGYLNSTVEKLRHIEDSTKEKYPVLKPMHATESLVGYMEKSGKWFVDNGAGLMGDLLTCLILVPILTFVLLMDGRSIRRRFFQLVPNRFFEVIFMVTHEIGTSLADYIRAKLIEAILVGLLTSIGLALIGAPYAVVLGLVAGVTNILPYIGPFIGAAPGILIAALDPELSHLIMPITAVYVTVNVIDTILIFPVIVAQLVNLHPLILIAVVMVGQQYYGLVGMLISIPIASALKVILLEIYSAVYEQRTARKAALDQAPGPAPVMGE